MSRLPIRVRLTAAFGAAMLVMLAGAFLFVYLRLEADLDDRIDATLRSRARALQQGSRPIRLTGIALEDAEESFVQILGLDGHVRSARGRVRGPALRRTDVERAARSQITVERNLRGIDGTARILSRPAVGDDAVLVVGQSLIDRNDALSSVVWSFTAGGAIAIFLASGVGYLLASAGLGPVEAMRRRAREVSLTQADEGLPLPAAHDEIRRLGETLNEMLARLRDAFERESRFVADASHELRTPIAVIKTELEGAMRSPDAGPSVRISLHAAIEECDRLAQLAEDLLVIVKAGDGRLPMRLETVEVGTVLWGVRDRFVDRADARGRAILIECAPGLMVHADPIRLRQAIGNLVDNALRHGDGAVMVQARPATTGIEIAVSDEGPGFADDVVARAFERFARGDRARGGGGAGLGLAIVQTIADAHHGHAAIVENAATVALWLPDRVSS